jgi:hypothetical protein
MEVAEPDVTTLRALSKLSELRLFEAPIRGDLAPLARLRTLRSLDLYGALAIAALALGVWNPEPPGGVMDRHNVVDPRRCSAIDRRDSYEACARRLPPSSRPLS